MNPAYVGAKTGARGVEIVPRGTISRRAEDRVFKLFHVEQSGAETGIGTPDRDPGSEPG
jgi:hypothetical protein